MLVRLVVIPCHSFAMQFHAVQFFSLSNVVICSVTVRVFVTVNILFENVISKKQTKITIKITKKTKINKITYQFFSYQCSFSLL